MLAPEVVQALVEHCSACGKPDRIERCVLHLDVLGLDLDQVREGSRGQGRWGDGKKIMDR